MVDALHRITGQILILFTCLFFFWMLLSPAHPVRVRSGNRQHDLFHHQLHLIIEGLCLFCQFLHQKLSHSTFQTSSTLFDLIMTEIETDKKVLSFHRLLYLQALFVQYYTYLVLIIPKGLKISFIINDIVRPFNLKTYICFKVSNYPSKHFFI